MSSISHADMLADAIDKIRPQLENIFTMGVPYIADEMVKQTLEDLGSEVIEVGVFGGSWLALINYRGRVGLVRGGTEVSDPSIFSQRFQLPREMRTDINKVCKEWSSIRSWFAGSGEVIDWLTGIKKKHVFILAAQEALDEPQVK